ncbi:hypothetical protein D7D25_16305 [Proteiniphilum sp. X52]|nr:hypothetical protein D7D25_16305 [Proteiniphilum sp. X52]
MSIVYKTVVGLTISILVSCNSSHKQDMTIRFQEEHFLKHTAYDTELFIKQGQITVIDSFLILVSIQQDPLCKIYSIPQNMKELYGYGSIGNGPGEFLQPLLTYSHNNTFGLNEINKKELAVLQLVNENKNVSIIESRRLKAVTKNEKEKVFRTDYYFARLDNEHYVSLLYEGENKFFSLFDSTLTLICRFGESPIPEEVSPMVAVNRLQGRVAASDGTMVFATTYLPYLACYQLNNEAMEKKWNIFYNQPYYAVRNEDLLYDKDKSFGQMMNLKKDDHFIYLLYLDQLLSDYDFNEINKSMANVILVFDYDGNAIAKLHLSCRINRMALSNDGKKLYGIAHLPEPTIVEFNLPLTMKQ